MKKHIHHRVRRKESGLDLDLEVNAVISVNANEQGAMHVARSVSSTASTGTGSPDGPDDDESSPPADT